MEGQQKYYVDENGQWEFPLGLRQLAMVQMDLNGRNKYGQDSGVGNVGNGLRMRFPIDRQRLEQSIQRVVDENDALRLILVQKGDTYTQRVLTHYQFQLQVYEAQGDRPRCGPPARQIPAWRRTRRASCPARRRSF